MKRFFPKKLHEFRNAFIACYIISSAFIAYYSYKSYKTFFVEKKFAMELAAYKIAADLTNIFDHAELSLNKINRQIVLSNQGKEALNEILIDAGKSYKENLLKAELSTGKFYWIDSKRYLTANSDVGVIADPLDLSSRDYLQNTEIDARKIYIGAPIIGALSGQNVLPMGVGAQDSKGNYIGTIAVSFKLSDLVARYREIAALSGVEFAILNDKNEVIVESKDGVFANDKKMFEDLNKKEITVINNFVTNFELTKRANSFAALRSSDKYQYKIIAGFENKNLQKELLLKTIFNVAQLLFLTIFFAVAIFYMRKDSRKLKF